MEYELPFDEIVVTFRSCKAMERLFYFLLYPYQQRYSASFAGGVAQTLWKIL